jgi:branched-subunit amino acid transport protein
MSTWLAIVGVGAVTFLMRASFIVFADPQRFPPHFRHASDSCRRRCLAGDRDAWPCSCPRACSNSPWAIPARLPGSSPSSWRVRTRSVLATIVSGMVALWLLQWAIG